MGFDFRNLNADTRTFMVEEIESDIAAGELYLSPRLTAGGRAAYPNWLLAAAKDGSDDTLAATLQGAGAFHETEKRRTKKGVTDVRVPVTAGATLAEGEFNRFYIRGLCRLAISQGQTHVTVYRAKAVENARSESVSKIGTRVSAEALLADLRESIGVDTALGLPPGPNSGLSVEL